MANARKWGNRERATPTSKGRSSGAEAGNRGAKERATPSSKGRSMEGRTGCAVGPEAAKPKRKWRGNGAALLKKAADQVVAENSEELANVLLKDALKGKMESARLLVTLSEKKEQAPARRRRGQSWAEELAAEPEWDPERDGGLTAEDLPGSEENWREECAGAFEKGPGGLA